MSALYINSRSHPYLEERSWVKLRGYGRERVEAVGIMTEEGMDRAISDWRKENLQHWR